MLNPIQAKIRYLLILQGVALKEGRTAEYDKIGYTIDVLMDVARSMDIPVTDVYRNTLAQINKFEQ